MAKIAAVPTPASKGCPEQQRDILAKVLADAGRRLVIEKACATQVEAERFLAGWMAWHGRDHIVAHKNDRLDAVIVARDGLAMDFDSMGVEDVYVSAWGCQ